MPSLLGKDVTFTAMSTAVCDGPARKMIIDPASGKTKLEVSGGAFTRRRNER